MAFNTKPAAPAETNDSWKAAGFLNLYLPTKDGGRRKLGAVPLRVSNVNEKALLEWITEDPTRVDIIKAKVVVEYNSAEPAEGTGFDLG